MEFQEILNDELDKLGITYKQLGKMCGLTGRAISYYANGLRIPSICAADKVLKALGVTMVLGSNRKEDADE